MATIGNSTLGMVLAYKAETTAGTRPTTGYTAISGIKNIPSIGEEASAIDVTPLEETNFMQYVAGLKDTGGNLAFTANNTDAFQTAWGTLVSTYAGLTDGKAMWFCITHPNLAKGFYFTGEPVKLGFTSADVNSALNATGNIIAGKVHGWDTKPTSGS